MAVPNTFGTATSAIPLSQLDANFNTPITLGNTAIQLGDTVTTLNNMTLANVTISSGNVTITNVAITTANVSGTANISTLVVVGNATVGGNTTITGNITAANANVTTNLVLSNGTANGVAYLNGANVLTTGSALVFDGSRIALSTTTSNIQLTTTVNTNQAYISLADADGRTAVFRGPNSGSPNCAQIGTVTNHETAFLYGNAEQMRLTSTSLYTASTINVGIGMSNPTAKLNVAAANGLFGVANGNTAGGMKLQAFNAAGNANGYLAFEGYSSEYGRFDASGNLGLGVTPSANAGQRTLSIANYTGTFSSLTMGGNGTAAGYVGYNMGNTSTNTAWRYLTADTGSALWFAGNEMRFMLFPAGSAGATTSGTQAMTLDASGRLLLNRTTNNNNEILQISGNANTLCSAFFANTTTGQSYGAYIAAGTNSTDYALRIQNAAANTDYLKVTGDGNLLVGKTAVNATDGGFLFTAGAGTDQSFIATNIRSDGGGEPVVVNRQGSDGTLIDLRQANTSEGTISVSGTTVSYNGGHLSRWAQTTDPKDESLVKGTVLSNLDAMNVYTDAEGNPVDNEQLNKVKVSDVEGDANVAGVFVNWSHDKDHNVDEINMAMTGDMIIRIAQGVTVVRGDLLMSAGDGTAKPQGDDIVRSKTVAKVTSTHVTCTYADGSYCVPCVLMAC